MFIPDSRRVDQLVVMPRFDGTGDLELFLQRFRTLANYYRILSNCSGWRTVFKCNDCGATRAPHVGLTTSPPGHLTSTARYGPSGPSGPSVPFILIPKLRRCVFPSTQSSQNRLSLTYLTSCFFRYFSTLSCSSSLSTVVLSKVVAKPIAFLYSLALVSKSFFVD